MSAEQSFPQQLKSYRAEMKSLTSQAQQAQAHAQAQAQAVTLTPPSMYLSGYANLIQDGSKRTISATSTSCGSGCGCGSGSAMGSIFLGQKEASQLNMQTMKKHNITAIVNCTPNLPCVHEHHEHEHLHNIEYCIVPVNDEMGADIFPYLWGSTEFIHEHVVGTRYKSRSRGSSFRKDQASCTYNDSNEESSKPEPELEPELKHKSIEPGSVLVHCQQGISRSATVVLAYLIRYENMSLEEALIHVKKQRRFAQPNLGFWKQLKQFEQCVCEDRVGREDRLDRFGRVDVVGMPGVGVSTPSNEDVSARMNINVEDFNFIKWAKLSSSIHATIGTHAYSLYGDSHCDNCIFGEIESKEFVTPRNVERLLNASLGYVWSRGLIEFDMRWLEALCRYLKRRGVDIVRVVQLALGDDSEFSNLWAGEIYPEREKVIQDMLSRL